MSSPTASKPSGEGNWLSRLLAGVATIPSRIGQALYDSAFATNFITPPQTKTTSTTTTTSSTDPEADEPPAAITAQLTKEMASIVTTGHIVKGIVEDHPDVEYLITEVRGNVMHAIRRPQ